MTQEMNRYIYRDLKLDVDSIRTNKLSLKTKKTGLVIFKSMHKKLLNI